MAKDWIGNANSNHSRLAVNKQHTTKDRQTDDFYATDPIALEMLLDNCSIYLRSVFYGTFCRCRNTHTIYHIWECACGNGNLADVLFKRGFHYYASDLKDRGYGSAYVDFLKHNGKFSDTEWNMADIILTNPPFALATEFIEHAVEILPEGGCTSLLWD